MAAAEPLNHLSLARAARAVAAREISAEALMRACLERIAEREPVVGAWASIDTTRALEEARACDRGGFRGPLHGVPVGVKDVLNTQDLPTEMGSKIYAGHRPFADAACVAALRSAGAIVLGKTVTCEFAGVEAGATANPLDPSRTPGGSSSGSGAAVADFMVPAALGTQTGGSVLRPASFCGVVGFKPTYGLVSRDGLKFAAESLDTVGVIARTPDDALTVADVMAGRPIADAPRFDRSPVLGVCRTDMWDAKASAASQACVERTIELARRAGARIVDFQLPHAYSRLLRARDLVNDVERARALAWEWRTRRDDISARLRATVERGLATSAKDYEEELRLAERARVECDARLDELDGVVAPCVNGEAPVGLAYAGDPTLQGVWTLLHVPTLVLPAGRGSSGMPIGVQLIGRRWRDRTLVGLADWLLAAGLAEEAAH